MKTYTLYGQRITDFQTFLKEFGEMVNGPGGYFGNNLLQFDDCLFGYGGLEYPCEIIWENHQASKEALAEDALIKEYNRQLEGFRRDLEEEEGDEFGKDMIEYYSSQMSRAKRGELTLFEEILDCIVSAPVRNENCRIKLVLK